MFGILNVNKPAGLTSRDVVNRIQRLVRPLKVGHAGTLDPLATGVLVVGLGAATRLVEYVQRMPKQYTGSFLFGRASDTEDIEGHVVELPDAPQPTRDELENALRQFIGEIEQRPPAFSAVKVKGERAYDLARKGKTVELASRPVMINALKLIEFDYPRFTLEINCGSGTYIRSLGRDIAASLHTSAVMSSLVRTAIGVFRIGETCDVDSLTADNLLANLRPAIQAVADLPMIQLTDEEVRRLANGMTIDNRSGRTAGEIAATDKTGRLVAILIPRDSAHLRPIRNLAIAESH